jgi:PAS domain-containing protein
MRDEHRPKQELIHEITGLRKQVLDLKAAMTARRRVEDALRDAEALLRRLSDDAPIGLCLFCRDGTLVTSNRPFARMLGYDSPAELQRVAGVLGVFATPEEQTRVLATPCCVPRSTLFRDKSGSSSTFESMLASTEDQDSAVLVVFQQISIPHGTSQLKG